MIYGAKYSGVPHTDIAIFSETMLFFESPKSVSLICPSVLKIEGISFLYCLGEIGFNLSQSTRQTEKKVYKVRADVPNKAVNVLNVLY